MGSDVELPGLVDEDVLGHRSGSEVRRAVLVGGVQGTCEQLAHSRQPSIALGDRADVEGQHHDRHESHEAGRPHHPARQARSA